jgi:hypothetical protein
MKTLASVIELIQEDQVNAYRAIIDGMLDLPLYNEVKLKDMVMGFRDFVPPNPTVFDLALTFRAPRIIASMQNRNPSPVTAQPSAPPPLLITLDIYVHPPSTHVLLDHSADPNCSFRGRTVWQYYLEGEFAKKNCLHPRLFPGSGI